MTRPMLTRYPTNRFRLANTAFVPSLTVQDSAPGRFRVQMSAEAIEGFPRLRSVLRFRRILQLAGVDVGSVALTTLVGAPAKIVAVCSGEANIDALAEFARNRGIEDRLRIYHGVALNEHSRLTEIVDNEFGDAGLEVVIDDVSNDLASGLSVFETLFPLLAPDGSYLIERWSWDHFVVEGWLAAADGNDAAAIEAQRAEVVASVRATKGEILEAILPRLVEAARMRPDVVASVTASKHWLEVRRGPARVDPSTFRLSDQ